MRPVLSGEVLNMKKLLYIDSCVKRETSRTERLAQALLKKLMANGEYELETFVLENMNLPHFDEKMLEVRDAAIAAQDFSAPAFDIVHTFKEADEIVIAAPYWDLSFPSMLKVFIEHLCVNGLTFRYSEEGYPVGLCKAEKMHYVSTVGGFVYDYNFGYEYVEAVLRLYFGIKESKCYLAEGLDIVGNDPDAIMAEAIAKL